MDQEFTQAFVALLWKISSFGNKEPSLTAVVLNIVPEATSIWNSIRSKYLAQARGLGSVIETHSLDIGHG